MTTPTRFLQDIFREPAEMRQTVEYLVGPGRNTLQRAVDLIQSARDIFFTGIGASWNAALCAGTLFDLGARPTFMREAGELLHFTNIPSGAVIITISRTGRSIEIVQLLAKAKASGATIIAITNSADSPLAQQAAAAIVIPAMLDHAISVNAYSTLLIAASALASLATNSSTSVGFGFVATALVRTISETGKSLRFWQQQLEESSWLAEKAPYYFLSRGRSLGTCYEARLLWEEGVKTPATAMSTNSFRHGPQEIVGSGLRVCMWIDQAQLRDQDLSVAYDLRELGASVMLIGENLPRDAGDLVFHLPTSPLCWQFLIDIFPIQLAAERLSRLAGVDCDSFRICSYVVEDEHGLLRKKAEVSPNAD